MAKESEKSTGVNPKPGFSPDLQDLPEYNLHVNNTKRNLPEYTTQLTDGIVIYINQLGSYINEKKRFLVTDTTGKYGSFVITADGTPLEGESLTAAQTKVVQQIKNIIQEISSS